MSTDANNNIRPRGHCVTACTSVTRLYCWLCTVVVPRQLLDACPFYWPCLHVAGFLISFSRDSACMRKTSDRGRLAVAGEQQDERNRHYRNAFFIFKIIQFKLRLPLRCLKWAVMLIFRLYTFILVATRADLHALMLIKHYFSHIVHCCCPVFTICLTRKTSICCVLVLVCAGFSSRVSSLTPFKDGYISGPLGSEAMCIIFLL